MLMVGWQIGWVIKPQKMSGRLTINPIAHWDPVGTTLLVGLLLISGVSGQGFVFGWGKPVPINGRNFKNYRNDMLKTGLAGPVSNFLLAILLAIIIRLIPEGIFYLILLKAIIINITLGVFNLIPLPPLDGSQILQSIVSEEVFARFEQLSFIYMICIIAILFAFPSILSNIIFSYS